MNFLLIWREWLVLSSITAVIVLLICLIRKLKLSRTIGWLGFSVYLMTLICLTILPFPTRQTMLSWTELREGIDLLPIRPLQESWAIVEIYLARGDRAPLHTFLWNNVGNLLVLMPLAAYLYVFFKKRFFPALLISIVCSILIETTQAVLCVYFGVLYRVIDINDVILNGSGALLILALLAFSHSMKSKYKLRRARQTKQKRRR